MYVVGHGWAYATATCKYKIGGKYFWHSTLTRQPITSPWQHYSTKAYVYVISGCQCTSHNSCLATMKQYRKFKRYMTYENFKARAGQLNILFWACSQNMKSRAVSVLYSWLGLSSERFRGVIRYAGYSWRPSEAFWTWEIEAILGDFLGWNSVAVFTINCWDPYTTSICPWKKSIL